VYGSVGTKSEDDDVVVLANGQQDYPSAECSSDYCGVKELLPLVTEDIDREHASLVQAAPSGPVKLFSVESGRDPVPIIRIDEDGVFARTLTDYVCNAVTP